MVGVALATVFSAGCSGQVEVGTERSMSKEQLQSFAKEKLEAAAGTKARSVECEGGVPAKVGATQRCILTAIDGTRIGVTATVSNVEGEDVRVNVKVDDQPMG